MGFITSLFGGAGSTLITVLFALGIVLVLIILGVWALKMLFTATGNVGRGNNRRLSVIDNTAIDPKRQLVLVRRDNVEHLLVLGGPQDMVVETNITPPPDPEPLKRPKRRLPSLQKAEPPKQSEPVAERIQESAPKPPPAPEPRETPAVAPIPVAASSVSIVGESDSETDTTSTQTRTRRRLTSLRHTGLLRPANRIEPEVHPQPSNDENEFDNEETNDSDTKSAELNSTTADEVVVEAEKTTDDSGSDSPDENHDAQDQEDHKAGK